MTAARSFSRPLNEVSRTGGGMGAAAGGGTTDAASAPGGDVWDGSSSIRMVAASRGRYAVGVPMSMSSDIIRGSPAVSTCEEWTMVGTALAPRAVWTASSS